jgi:hypothetical protein
MPENSVTSAFNMGRTFFAIFFLGCAEELLKRSQKGLKITPFS